jgi:acyl-CoA synthetase (AMP-forming)/AMP-acid ligase II
MNLSGLTNCYGLTEASPIACMTRISDPLELKLKTVGQVLPHTSIRITARDDPHRILPRGEKGEIQIGGYSVMKGYWRAEAETEKVFVREDHHPHIWLRSGDEGLMDADGNIRITGRIKDIIIRGGENIYPAEIENCLLQHDLIANASVVALPDARYGEVVAAFVLLQEGVTPDVEEKYSGDLRISGTENGRNDSKYDLVMINPEKIRSWVRQLLSKMLVPKYVFWVSQMPLTASGKVEKYKLRKMGEQWLRQ